MKIKENWLKLARKIESMNTKLILFVVYSFMVLPLRVLLFFRSNKPIQKAIDPQLSTYKIKAENQDLVVRMKGPF